MIVFASVLAGCQGNNGSANSSRTSNIEIIANEVDVEKFLKASEVVYDRIWVPSAKDVPTSSELVTILRKHVGNDYQMDSKLSTEIGKMAVRYHWKVSGLVVNGVKYLIVQGLCWRDTVALGKFGRIPDGGVCTIEFVLECDTRTVLRFTRNPG